MRRILPLHTLNTGFLGEKQVYIDIENSLFYCDFSALKNKIPSLIAKAKEYIDSYPTYKKPFSGYIEFEVDFYDKATKITRLLCKDDKLKIVNLKKCMENKKSKKAKKEVKNVS